jgi:hypothetical protein
MGLKNLLKNEKPLKQNSPASPGFKILETSGNVLAEKVKWVDLIEGYANYANNGFVHWFFGKMTKEEVGYFFYKYTGHYLRQFNC